MNTVPHKMTWQEARKVVLDRDNWKCVTCGESCRKDEVDVHHLIPRSFGGSDEPSNLITLCDGCHGAHHPNLQMALSRRFIEKWAIRLAKWLDANNELPDDTANLSGALRLFRLERLRENQLEVVLAALKGESVLLVSPTGSGKTLCFQLPTLMRDGTAFIISPLKALMSDQVSILQRNKIPGSFINSDLNPQEKERRYELLEKQALKFFYCTPERFDATMVRPDEIQRVSRVKPSYLVIDEAHCIDRWGDDFRPSYSRLTAVRALLGNPPVLAFTATAGVKTQRRILDSLGTPNARVVVADVNRPNIALLRLHVGDSDNIKFKTIKNLLLTVNHGHAMIFVPTVKIGSKLQKALMAMGLDLPFYHSKHGTANERELIIGRFTGRLDPPIPAIICTNAFGMGLDVPDVRLVIHWQHPASVEDYLQEFGRAGRDGKQSLAVLLTSNNDESLLNFMAHKTVENLDLDAASKDSIIKNKLSKIHDIYLLATDKRRCFRKEISRYFVGDKPNSSKSLALRIVEWLFSVKRNKTKFNKCCDRCDKVTIDNYIDWTNSVFH